MGIMQLTNAWMETGWYFHFGIRSPGRTEMPSSQDGNAIPWMQWSITIVNLF